MGIVVEVGSAVYSGRLGLPQGVDASRGIASDAPIPADMLTPELLRPFSHASPR